MKTERMLTMGKIGHIDVLDVTLRDGLQHEEIFVPTEAKLYLANQLIEAGFKNIEVGTFSHVKYVPQFKDIEELLERLPKRDDVQYTVLALNAKACERVAGALDKGAKIDRVLCGQLATSEAYARKNMNRTHEELFAEARKNVKFLHRIGVKRVFANVGTIFGCPVQGKVSIAKAYEFCDRVFDLGFDEIEHSDTEGLAAPDVVYEYFVKVLSKYPDRNMHSFHVHDVRGMGLATYYAAMEAGITAFDSTLGGIGGQVANIVDKIPCKGTGDYYYNDCRTGLVETCDFVGMLEEMKIDTGIDVDKTIKTCIMLEKILGRRLDSYLTALARQAM